MDTRRDTDARSHAERDAEPAQGAAADAAIFNIEPLRRDNRPLRTLAAAVVALGILGVGVGGVIGRAPSTPMAAEVATGARGTDGADDADGADGAQVVDDPASPASRRFLEGPLGVTPDATPASGGLTPGRMDSPLLTVDANRSDGLVFVHGDVFTRRVVTVLVMVSVVDRHNGSLALQSVDMPGGSTAFRLGANDRFDVVFEMPGSRSMLAATITANAYDDTGAVIATASERLSKPATESRAAGR